MDFGDPSHIAGWEGKRIMVESELEWLDPEHRSGNISGGVVLTVPCTDQTVQDSLIAFLIFWIQYPRAPRHYVC